MSPGPARPTLRDLLGGWRDRTWPHRLLAGPRWTTPARVVAVAGVSARAGTTTVAALLATAYAAPGRGRVAVLDAAAGPLGPAESWAALGSHLDPVGPGLWAVPPGRGPDLLAAQAALAALSPHVAVAVVDCGEHATAPARFLLGLAHARLLVATASVDGVLAAAAALDRLGSPDRTVVALVGRSRVDPAEAGALLGARGGEVRCLPYDPGLAGAGVSAGLRAAVLGTAAELLRRAG